MKTTFTPGLLERGGGPGKLPESTRALLVKNGTLNRDGSYNVETARAVAVRQAALKERQLDTEVRLDAGLAEHAGQLLLRAAELGELGVDRGAVATAEDLRAHGSAQRAAASPFATPSA